MIHSTKRPVVIFDIDNTLYNFVDFFGPAFRAMVHVIGSRTAIPETELFASFKRVYSERGSLEYRYSIQELDVLNNYTKDELSSLLHASFVAFSKSRNLRLVPYDGVKEILNWLHRSGYKLIAYTDAPHKHSANRLKKLGIKSYFDILVAWGPSLTNEDFSTQYSEKITNSSGDWYITENDRSYMMGNMQVLTHPSEEKKPNIDLLCRLTNELSIDVQRSWVVGDSVEKDLVPGMELGFKGAWAKYGKKYEQKNWETLVSVSPWDTKTIKKEEKHNKTEPIEPDWVLDSFYSLRNAIKEIQLSLF
ncbi:MAG: HAD family hydrolase [Candidatus Thiodiazotropha endolucinida]|uniref:HAD family hydrolase n=1 Tax=Candidatus Thiodiazotropha taylori TaxID=2792791 RepID=A0A9E4NHY7_9GAMM|nr:HAD family hydrolase [Candidatus Thiodiazotropha taylori]MCW4235374.1 HAD family hydrolase [Candidatus Thiodiazotropha endolucinida]